jgi:uncharacterized Fe-S cluster-containing protein
MLNTKTYTVDDLPGLNCGICGYRTCEDLVAQLGSRPELIERCIQRSQDAFEINTPAVSAQPTMTIPVTNVPVSKYVPVMGAQPDMAACGDCTVATRGAPRVANPSWHDTLGREFDFYLEHFPEDPGPREIILPHNPLITREMNIQRGDILIGRPLGMSCGCPITHCGVAMDVDARTGVIVWCVTGPLNPRQKGFKDLGYYIAEGYEGMISQARIDIRIGMRYFFQPRMCMLQWRHSGLVNYLNRTNEGLQVRVEGLWIG